VTDSSAAKFVVAVVAVATDKMKKVREVWCKRAVKEKQGKKHHSV
jgi:hypothetical protein